MALAGKTVVVDARWLHHGGPGRVTELLLRGLGQIQPPGTWVLWGPDAVRSYVWAGSTWRLGSDAPKRAAGQAEVARVPAGDAVLYPHHVRPFRPGRSVTLIHDTIPIRAARNPLARAMARPFLRAAARLSSRIVTASDFARRCIERDLGVPTDKISVVHYPVDRDMVARVEALRSRHPVRSVALYVGRFARHKDVPTLVDAFASTAFARDGGSLALVGGTPDEVAAVSAYVRRRGVDRVTVRGACPQEDLELLYATSRLLVMPSREEGFGLPVWEAMTCGLPVCVSDGGALPELTTGVADPFPAGSTPAMAAAIDRVSAGPERVPQADGPSVTDLAESFVAEVAAAIAPSA